MQKINWSKVIWYTIYVIIFSSFILINHFVLKLPNLCGGYGTPCNLTGLT